MSVRDAITAGETGITNGQRFLSPGSLCQGERYGPCTWTIQVQAQDEANPIAPTPGAASATRISPIDDPYSTKDNDRCERSKCSHVSMWLREVRPPSGRVIFWLELESMGETVPLPLAGVHKRSSGRLARPPRLIFWVHNTSAGSDSLGGCHLDLTHMNKEWWAGELRQRAGVFLFTGWSCSARGYQDGLVCASIICLSDKMVNKA